MAVQNSNVDECIIELQSIINGISPENINFKSILDVLYPPALIQPRRYSYECVAQAFTRCFGVNYSKAAIIRACRAIKENREPFANNRKGGGQTILTKAEETKVLEIMDNNFTFGNPKTVKALTESVWHDDNWKCLTFFTVRHSRCIMKLLIDRFHWLFPLVESIAMPIPNSQCFPRAGVRTSINAMTLGVWWLKGSRKYEYFSLYH